MTMIMLIMLTWYAIVYIISRCKLMCSKLAFIFKRNFTKLNFQTLAKELNTSFFVCVCLQTNDKLC